MDDRTLERAARNEVAFRDVNERLRASTTVADADKLFTFTCECGWLGCNRMVELSVPEYEAVRADPRRFFIVDGHEIPEAEKVVGRHERYVVVEKTDEEGRIAEEEDPRRDERPG